MTISHIHVSRHTSLPTGRLLGHGENEVSSWAVGEECKTINSLTYLCLYQRDVLIALESQQSAPPSTSASAVPCYSYDKWNF